MRRRRLERLSNLPLRSNSGPSGQEVVSVSVPISEGLSSSVPNIVHTSEEVYIAMATGGGSIGGALRAVYNSPNALSCFE